MGGDYKLDYTLKRTALWGPKVWWWLQIGLYTKKGLHFEILKFGGDYKYGIHSETLKVGGDYKMEMHEIHSNVLGSDYNMGNAL